MLVEVNDQVFQREVDLPFELWDGRYYLELDGETVPRDGLMAFCQVLENLESYPCLDDDSLSQAELDLAYEAWEDYGKEEVISAWAEKLPYGDLIDWSDAELPFDEYMKMSRWGYEVSGQDVHFEIFDFSNPFQVLEVVEGWKVDDEMTLEGSKWHKKE